MKMQRTIAWFPLGVAFGTAMGSATDDMAVWIAIGAAIGTALTAPWKRCPR